LAERAPGLEPRAQCAHLCDAPAVPLQPHQLLPCAHIKQANALAVAACCQQVRLKGVEGQTADDACGWYNGNSIFGCFTGYRVKRRGQTLHTRGVVDLQTNTGVNNCMQGSSLTTESCANTLIAAVR
jgi:hypothetical protein